MMRSLSPGPASWSGRAGPAGQMADGICGKVRTGQDRTEKKLAGKWWGLPRKLPLLPSQEAYGTGTAVTGAEGCVL